MHDRKKNSTFLYFALAAVAVLLTALIGLLFTLPKPLSRGEESLVGHWVSVPSAPYEKEMTFHPNRVVDITNTGVTGVVFRWKIEGSRLFIKEGRGPWDKLNDFTIEGARFSVGSDEHKVEFARVKRAK